VVDTESPPLAESPARETNADLFNALCLGLRDYLRKCGFKSAVIG
jgi:hypothetical protein